MKFTIILALSFIIYSLWTNSVQQEDTIHLSSIPEVSKTIESQTKTIEIYQMLTSVDSANIEKLKNIIEENQVLISELENRLVSCQIWNRNQDSILYEHLIFYSKALNIPEYKMHYLESK